MTDQHSPTPQIDPARVPPAVVVGIGEIGGVFARGFLASGRAVLPVTRHIDVSALARRVREPAVVLVAVGESDLDATLAAMPLEWSGRLALCQNELLPHTWERHGLVDPSVAVVWFEKKKGQDVKVIIPTGVAGPCSAVLIEALSALSIPTDPLGRSANDTVATDAMVAKNLYILTSNIAGLETGGTVGELWNDHRDLAEQIADEVLDIQESLLGYPVDRREIRLVMIEAIEADPAHPCTGRSAPTRLARAIGHADEAGLAAPHLRRIATDLNA